MSTLGRWPATAAAASTIIAVAAVAAVPAASAASAATSSAANSSAATTSPAAVSITIHTRSTLPKVTGRTLVAYRGRGGSTTATVRGVVSGAHRGDKATLLYEHFGARSYAKGGSVTLGSGSSAPYSFQVRPEIATSYKIQVTGSGLGAVPDSPVRTVFVEALGSITGPRSCSRPARPVCHIRLRLFVNVPVSAYRKEAGKHWYLYAGLRLARHRTPPAPRTLTLSPTASASRPQRKHLYQFVITLRYRFRIGRHDGFSWRVNFCTRDSESRDGLGLPGHHGCGNKRISARTSYLG
ncbi:MAG TPA: hypothetical protein VHU92_23715 [Streptosporangiaceae bacterium]|nr:hypothetical protein [Streptosporangiaceae bacterium]